MNKSNYNIQLGSLENLIKVFKHSHIQVGTLNNKIKATFSPIRVCVKNCTSELEQISDLLGKELESVELLNKKYLAADVFNCFKASFKSTLEHQQFLKMVNERLDSYQIEVNQTKAAINQICALYLSSKTTQSYPDPSDNTRAEIDKVHFRLNQLETSIRQLQTGINNNTAIAEGTTIKTEKDAIEFRHDLITILENIQSKSKQQLHLKELSLNNLKELSTFLQFEDIIGQKLEHIVEILNLVIGGLAEKESQKSVEDSPYYTLIPELSALIISHLNLVQEEYQTVLKAVLENASSVKGNLDQIGNSTSAALADIESKLNVINNIYQSMEAFLKKLFSEDLGIKRISQTLETYFSSILDNAQSVFDQIMVTQILEDDCRDQLQNIQGMMNNIYDSIKDTISQKKETDESLLGSIKKFRNALDGFHELSQKVISKDIHQKLILNQKSQLSESLSRQIEANLNQLEANNLLDRIIRECKEGLIDFAKNTGGRKLSDKEVDAYRQLREIYSMDSERTIHETNLKKMGIIASGNDDELKQDTGTVELF